MTKFTDEQDALGFKFESGHIVRLRSGGPRMTVRDYVPIEAAYWVGREPGVHVSWFVDKTCFWETYAPAMLEHVDP